MPTSFLANIRRMAQLTLLQQPEPVSQEPVPWPTRIIKHRIPAGFPSPAAEYTEAGLDLNDYLIVHKAATFMFTVVGNSMSKAGILDGDKVVVDRSVAPRHGHIVIAMLNGEYTIKRLYMRGGVIELRPENPDFQPIKLSGEDELQIWGVVTGCIRKLQV
jgi:DNA polymerase V